MSKTESKATVRNNVTIMINFQKVDLIKWLFEKVQ